MRTTNTTGDRVDGRDWHDAFMDMEERYRQLKRELNAANEASRLARVATEKRKMRNTKMNKQGDHSGMHTEDDTTVIGGGGGGGGSLLSDRTHQFSSDMNRQQMQPSTTGTAKKAPAPATGGVGVSSRPRSASPPLHNKKNKKMSVPPRAGTSGGGRPASPLNRSGPSSSGAATAAGNPTHTHHHHHQWEDVSVSATTTAAGMESAPPFHHPQHFLFGESVRRISTDDASSSATTATAAAGAMPPTSTYARSYYTNTISSSESDPVRLLQEQLRMNAATATSTATMSSTATAMQPPSNDPVGASGGTGGGGVSGASGIAVPLFETHTASDFLYNRGQGIMGGGGVGPGGSGIEGGSSSNSSAPPDPSLLLWGVNQYTRGTLQNSAMNVLHTNDILRTSLEEATTNLKVAQNELAAARRLVAHTQQQVDEGRVELAQVVRERDIAQHKHQQASQSAEQLKDLLKQGETDKETLRFGLEAQIRELRSRLVSSSESNDTLAADVRSLLTDLKEANGRCAAAHSRLTLQETDLAKQRNLNETMVVELDALNQQLASERRKLLSMAREQHSAAFVQDQLRELQGKLQESHASRQHLEKEHLRLLDDVASRAMTLAGCGVNGDRDGGSTNGGGSFVPSELLVEARAQATYWEQAAALLYQDIVQKIHAHEACRAECEGAKLQRDEASATLRTLRQDLTLCRGKLRVIWPTHEQDTAHFESPEAALNCMQRVFHGRTLRFASAATGGAAGSGGAASSSSGTAGLFGDGDDLAEKDDVEDDPLRAAADAFLAADADETIRELRLANASLLAELAACKAQQDLQQDKLTQLIRDLADREAQHSEGRRDGGKQKKKRRGMNQRIDGDSHDDDGTDDDDNGPQSPAQVIIAHQDRRIEDLERRLRELVVVPTRATTAAATTSTAPAETLQKQPPAEMGQIAASSSSLAAPHAWTVRQLGPLSVSLSTFPQTAADSLHHLPYPQSGGAQWIPGHASEDIAAAADRRQRPADLAALGPDENICEVFIGRIVRVGGGGGSHPTTNTTSAAAAATDISYLYDPQDWAEHHNHSHNHSHVAAIASGGDVSVISHASGGATAMPPLLFAAVDFLHCDTVVTDNMVAGFGAFIDTTLEYRLRPDAFFLEAVQRHSALLPQPKGSTAGVGSTTGAGEGGDGGLRVQLYRVARTEPTGGSLNHSEIHHSRSQINNNNNNSTSHMMTSQPYALVGEAFIDLTALILDFNESAEPSSTTTGTTIGNNVISFFNRCGVLRSDRPQIKGHAPLYRCSNNATGRSTSAAAAAAGGPRVLVGYVEVAVTMRLPFTMQFIQLCKKHNKNSRSVVGSKSESSSRGATVSTIFRDLDAALPVNADRLTATAAAGTSASSPRTTFAVSAAAAARTQQQQAPTAATAARAVGVVAMPTPSSVEDHYGEGALLEGEGSSSLSSSPYLSAPDAARVLSQIMLLSSSSSSTADDTSANHEGGGDGSGDDVTALVRRHAAEQLEHFTMQYATALAGAAASIATRTASRGGRTRSGGDDADDEDAAALARQFLDLLSSGSGSGVGSGHGLLADLLLPPSSHHRTHSATTTPSPHPSSVRFQSCLLEVLGFTLDFRIPTTTATTSSSTSASTRTSGRCLSTLLPSFYVTLSPNAAVPRCHHSAGSNSEAVLSAYAAAPTETATIEGGGKKRKTKKGRNHHAITTSTSTNSSSTTHTSSSSRASHDDDEERDDEITLPQHLTSYHVVFGGAGSPTTTPPTHAGGTPPSAAAYGPLALCLPYDNGSGSTCSSGSSTAAAVVRRAVAGMAEGATVCIFNDYRGGDNTNNDDNDDEGIVGVRHWGLGTVGFLVPAAASVLQQLMQRCCQVYQNTATTAATASSQRWVACPEAPVRAPHDHHHLDHNHSNASVLGMLRARAAVTLAWRGDGAAAVAGGSGGSRMTSNRSGGAGGGGGRTITAAPPPRGTAGGAAGTPSSAPSPPPSPIPPAARGGVRGGSPSRPSPPPPRPTSTPTPPVVTEPPTPTPPRSSGGALGAAPVIGGSSGGGFMASAVALLAGGPAHRSSSSALNASSLSTSSGSGGGGGGLAAAASSSPPPLLRQHTHTHTSGPSTTTTTNTHDDTTTPPNLRPSPSPSSDSNTGNSAEQPLPAAPAADHNRSVGGGSGGAGAINASVYASHHHHNHSRPSSLHASFMSQHSGTGGGARAAEGGEQ